MAAKPAPKPASKAKKASKPSGPSGRTLWLPNAEAPEWLDGSLPGDAGFDPLSLSKPAEYLQFDLDALDQNKPRNKAGQVLGKLKVAVESTEDSLVPYSEVFDINRFRECELIHGRWAMLATLGAVVAELNTGVNWVDAGKVELEQGSSYFGLEIPFDLRTLIILEVLLVGFVEVQRNNVRNIEERVYPGGAFDPLGLASKDEEQTFRLRTAEVKHSRLAMVAFFGYAVQAGTTGTGSILSNLKDVL
jgi:light-harvesting complex II chlorophyll a/b binding protein 4